ncbi:hypothetical protein OC844_002182 [Tilletia horrida]|nr:hypothetical protein OC844_002182 [Tilletia horrida]
MSSSSPPADQQQLPSSLLPRLQHALHRIATTRARTIASPPTQPRRASVAILVRIKPAQQDQAWLAAEFEATLNQADSDHSGGSASVSASDNEESPPPPPAPTASSPNDLEQSAVQISASDAALSSSATLPPPAPDASLVHLSQASLGPAPSPTTSQQPRTPPPVPDQLDSFFSKPWVQRGTPELLYIKRASRTGDTWSAHVAFPGGRAEPSDENGLYTAMRETWEEVGIDLAEPEFVSIGQLDDREITTSLGKRLLMVLSPYVFLQTSPFSPLPDLQPSEVSSAHWIPLRLLYTPQPRWGLTSVDIASRLAPKSPAVRWVLRALVGKMDFRCVLLPNQPIATANQEGELEEHGNEAYPPGERYPAPPPANTTASQFLIGADAPTKAELRLWGLTLGMTLDLLSHMSTLAVPGEGPPPDAPSTPGIAPLLQSDPAAGAGAGIGVHALPSTSSTALITHPSSSTKPRPALDRLAASTSSHALALRSTLGAAWTQLRADPRGTSALWLARLKDELHLTPPPHARALAPSMTSVFPRFSYPDVNFWIWVFGYRYRKIVRAWERGLGTGMERRVNCSAVRRALIVAILLRALSMLSVLTGISWLASRRMRRRRKGLPGLGLDELMPSLFADD